MTTKLLLDEGPVQKINLPIGPIKIPKKNEMDRTRTRSPFRLLRSQTLYSRVPPSARGYRQEKPRNTHVLVVSGHVVRRLPTHIHTREELDPHHTPFCFIISLLIYFHSLSLFISPHSQIFVKLSPHWKKKILNSAFKKKKRKKKKTLP